MYKQVNNENEIELERQSLLKLIEGKKLHFEINLHRENQKIFTRVN